MGHVEIPIYTWRTKGWAEDAAHTPGRIVEAFPGNSTHFVVCAASPDRRPHFHLVVLLVSAAAVCTSRILLLSTCVPSALLSHWCSRIKVHPSTVCRNW